MTNGVFFFFFFFGRLYSCAITFVTINQDVTGCKRWEKKMMDPQLLRHYNYGKNIVLLEEWEKIYFSSTVLAVSIS